LGRLRRFQFGPIGKGEFLFIQGTHRLPGKADARKLAQKDGVPVYQIFNNDQLARMVVDRATTKAALEKIEGVGEAKLAKYGSRFLDLLNKSMESQDETSGPAV
jgi:hypothetical protein